MTKKKELEEDVLKQKAIEEEVKEELGEVEKEEVKPEITKPEITKKESEIEEQEEKIDEEAESKKKAGEYLDGWKRCQADFENYKKDQEKRMGEFRKFANMDFIYQILPVLDNFQSATGHISQDQKESPWVAGIMHIQKQLEQVLKDNGVEEIIVKEGDEFDPEAHEAITDAKLPASLAGGRIESESMNKVKKVAQKGYRIGERVIRPARVIVE